MDEMNTITEHELREQLWASGNGVDPARLTTLADDALRQARRRQRTVHTAAALSAAVVVAAIGVTTSSVVGHSPRPTSVSGTAPASVSATSSAAGQRDPGPVRLVTPILLAPVKSVSAEACETGGYPGPPSAGTTGTSCFQLDSAHSMSVTEVAEIQAVPISTLKGSDGWEVDVTLLGTDKTAFSHLTAVTVNQQLATVVGGRVLNAPLIEEPITVGTFQITGFTQQSAKNLIIQLTGK